MCINISLNSPQERLTTTKVPPVMSTFWRFARRPEPESWIWQLSAKAKGKEFKQLTGRFCSDSVDICIVASGTNKGDNGLWVAKDRC